MTEAASIPADLSFEDALQRLEQIVQKLESGQAAGSRVRVLIESTDGERRWTTVGASTDIIEASFSAIVDSLEYKLLKENL